MNLLEKKNVEEEFKATFILTYLPSLIIVVEIENGKKSKLTRCKQQGKQQFSNYSLIEKDRIFELNASNRLEFEIEGSPGVFVAIYNANLQDSTLYVSNIGSAWKCKALVVIRSTRKTGIISLKVKSTDLKDSKINIQAIENQDSQIDWH